MCGRAERHQPEEEERGAEESRRGDHDGDRRERDPERKLEHENPEPLRPHHVDDRRPERLDDPGEIEEARIEGNIGV